jgi:hypothetical protein
MVQTGGCTGLVGMNVIGKTKYIVNNLTRLMIKLCGKIWVLLKIMAVGNKF